MKDGIYETTPWPHRELVYVIDGKWDFRRNDDGSLALPRPPRGDSNDWVFVKKLPEITMVEPTQLGSLVMAACYRTTEPHLHHRTLGRWPWRCEHDGSFWSNLTTPRNLTSEEIAELGIYVGN